MTIEAYAMAHGGGKGRNSGRPKRKGTFKDALAQFAPGIEIPGVTGAQE